MTSDADIGRRLLRLVHRVWFEWLAGNPRYQDSLDAARAARTRHDWVQASIHFQAASTVRPNSLSPRLNFGQALIELNRAEEAETVLREAVRRAPRSSDAYAKLGHCLTILGRHDQAAAAYSRSAALKTASAPVDRTEAWARFRKDLERPLPPTSMSLTPVVVLVDARGLQPSVLRAMLTSVIEQSDPDWIAVVQVDAGVADHPVGGFAYSEPRIHLVETVAAALTLDLHAKGETLLLDPGTILEPTALQWLRSINAKYAADAVFADYDHHHQDRRREPRWLEPVLGAEVGLLDLVSSPTPPPAALLFDHEWRALLKWSDALPAVQLPRETLVALLEAGKTVRHLPLVLASVQIAPPGRSVPPIRELAPVKPLTGGVGVIIPTRDEAVVLEACIASLIRLADQPELVDIIVLDNRSREQATTEALARLAETTRLTTIPVDEPFNWSRLNNTGAGAAPHTEVLVFVNNDLEMLSPGWDSELRVLLARPHVGAVGARLVYPDGSLQHVGIVLGAIGGRPIHDGRAAASNDGGPGDRWRRTRELGAVTGAFLAARRETFAEVGGFNEQLAVAYNDIDFCLRVRASGLSVVYAPAIEAIHYESKSRGLALTAERIAWDDEEFEQLRRTWGEACQTDPYVNPRWTFSPDRSFEAFRPVDEDAIAASLAGDKLIRLSKTTQTRLTPKPADQPCVRAANS